MEPDSKVKELEDELKVLKAEIRNVLLDIRENLLDKANPLSEEQESAYLRMDLNTTARAVAAEAAGREAGKVVGQATDEEPRESKPEEPKAGSDAGPPPEGKAAEETRDEEPTGSKLEEPRDEEPTESKLEEPRDEEPTETKLEEPRDEEPTESKLEEPKDGRSHPPPKGKASRKRKKQAPAPEPSPPLEEASYHEPTDMPIYPAYVSPTGGSASLAAWLAGAMSTIGPQQLERVIAVRRLWGNLPPSTCEALAHLQELVRSSNGQKLSWLEILRALERLTPS